MRFSYLSLDALGVGPFVWIILIKFIMMAGNYVLTGNHWALLSFQWMNRQWMSVIVLVDLIELVFVSWICCILSSSHWASVNILRKDGQCLGRVVAAMPNSYLQGCFSCFSLAIFIFQATWTFYLHLSVYSEVWSFPCTYKTLTKTLPPTSCHITCK